MLTLMWSAGSSCNQIAESLGTTKNAVAGRRHRLKLPMRRSPVETRAGYVGLVDRVAELLSHGLDFAEISQEMGLTYDTVRGMFQRIRFELGAQAI